MMNKEDIKNMFGQIQTPEYNPAIDVIKKISQGYKIKPKISRFKRTVIIAASIMAVIILMGVGIDMYVYRIFNEDGSSFLQYITRRTRSEWTDEELEQLAFRNEFFDFDNAENTLRLTVPGDLSGYGTSGIIGRYIYDYDEFIEFMKQTDSSIFKLPQYIPDGYEFYNAQIDFYIDENFDYENAELIKRAEKYGNIYEQYYIPENPENLNYISVSYIKEDIGVWIAYNIRLMEPNALNTSMRGLETSQLEILQIPQFYRSSIMSTDYTEDGRSWTKYTFEAVNETPVKRYLEVGMLNKEYRERPLGHYAPTELGSVHYDIQTHSASCDEIIKMAESIK